MRQEHECLVEHTTLRLDLTRGQRLVGANKLIYLTIGWCGGGSGGGSGGGGGVGEQLTPAAESQDSQRPGTGR